MKRILFVYRINKDNPTNQGVVKKLAGQISACQQLGWQVDYVIHGDHHLYLNQDVIGKVNMNTTLAKIFFYNHLSLVINAHDYDKIIIRYGLSTASFISWLRSVKKLHPAIKLIIDMPTFPYVKEWQGFLSKAIIWMDQRYARHLHHYIDEIWHSGNHSYIYDIPTKSLSNGIDTKSLLPMKRLTKLPIIESFVMVAVAKWDYWHGLDRLLQGLAQWSPSAICPKICLKIIGEGPTISTLKATADRLDINHLIEWQGTLVGEALSQELYSSHLGIGTLGLHRKGVEIDSSLKHREYCAHGLPFVLSSQDNDFPSELAFVQVVSSDDNAVQISKLILFYQALDDQIPLRIRQYAIEQLDWKQKLFPLLS